MHAYVHFFVIKLSLKNDNLQQQKFKEILSNQDNIRRNIYSTD